MKEGSFVRIEEHPILTFPKDRRKIEFTFEGKKMVGYEGDTIASALIAQGVKVFSYSHKSKRPRGFFCAVGKCSSCLMMVNGIRNVRTCITPLKDGMDIRRNDEDE